ncbi:MAG: ImmA/IrrE family metallo-endopeptidase [Eubacteriales bacterium]|nr:ImmA/IrrE family metallo-endopeptidase [Eubacteriales bacterium]
MDRIDELCSEAGELGIDVHQRDIPVPGMSAAYIRTDTGEHIVLKRDGTMAERACWLAEQLGHHYTGADRRLHYSAVDDWRAEAKARKWAHDRLLSPEAIRTAARNTDDIYEIAFTLNVSVEFLKESIDWYMARGLWTPDLQGGDPADSDSI